MAPSANIHRPDNLALIFQEVFTAIERLRSNRQGVSDSQSFRHHTREALKSAAGQALAAGYPSEDVKFATFATVAFLDESVLNSQNPVFTDWLRKPLQEELFGTHVAGEVFFQNLQQLLGRNDSPDLADLLEVHYLCLRLGFGGRYSSGNRGELAQVMNLTAEKMRRVRGHPGPLSPAWMLPQESVGSRPDPLVRKLGFLALACAILMLLLFGAYKVALGSGVSDVRAIAAPAPKIGDRVTTLYSLFAVALMALIVLVVLFYLRKKKAGAAARAGEPEAPGGDEISSLVHAAEARLSGSKLASGARIGNLPVYLLMGQPGSTKTSIMVNSGLDPELLAGQVYQNADVVPTRSANLWFSRRSIFVEAGGALLADSGQWNRLVRKLQPRSSLVGKGGQAPRAAVVCFDSETFTRAGAQEAVVNAARILRARLGEISQAFGINLPVYVLFTRMDRLPFFAEYVRNLSNDEATQVVGATLPLLTRRGEGVYGEEETARLSDSFERLFRSLADARPEFLGRETDFTKAPATYEFPREFRKIRPAVVQFLVDLCRPSQLSVGPVLRGFYFTGVRPIIINEAAPVAAAAPQHAAPATAAGAARRFSAVAQAPAAQAAPPAAAGTRKVPQWLFLSHLFNDILLSDRAAMGASGASIRTSFARRVLFLAAAVLCLALSVAFTVSFFKNRGLEARVRTAAEGYEAAGRDRR